MFAPTANPVVSVATAAGTRTFARLQNLVRSLGSQTCRDFQTSVIDVGLTEDERARLLAAGCTVMAPEAYVFPESEGEPQIGELRPSLNNLFADADVVIWIDAESWLQRPTFIGDLLAFLVTHEFLLAPAAHSAYGSTNADAHFSPLLGGFGRMTGRNYHLARSVYGSTVARSMAARPRIDSGLLAGWTHSAFWDHWKAIHGRAARFRTADGIDEVSLNATASIFRGRIGLLPASYDWLGRLALPAYDPETRLFVDPVLPMAPLHALSLRGVGDEPTALATPAGSAISISLSDPATVEAALAAAPGS